MNTPPEQAQLDRIESTINIVKAEVEVVVARVSKLEAKSSFWGAVGGAMVIVFTKLGGCL